MIKFSDLPISKKTWGVCHQCGEKATRTYGDYSQWMSFCDKHNFKTQNQVYEDIFNEIKYKFLFGKSN